MVTTIYDNIQSLKKEMYDDTQTSRKKVMYRGII